MRFQLDERGAEADFRSHRLPSRPSPTPRAGMVVALLGAAAEVSGMQRPTGLGNPIDARKIDSWGPLWKRDIVPHSSPLGGFDPVKPTCYKRLFCAGRAGSGFYFSCPLFQIDPGAKSDAAKLNTPSGLAVEACSEFRKP